MSGTERLVASVEAAEAAIEGQDAAQRSEPGRVVLRGVMAVVLDDLPAGTQRAVLEAAAVSPCEVWVAVAARTGQPDAAITSYAGKSGTPGCRPGQYKAVPRSSWFVPPLGIEPPLS